MPPHPIAPRRRPILPPAALAAALAFATMRCGAGTTEMAGPCTDPVTVSASNGSVPTISWAPTCGVRSLTVISPPSLAFGPATTYWHITSPTSSITSPVRYGMTPPGATEVVPATPLTPGRETTVSVSDATRGLGVATLQP